jgi:hypothetical protein
MAEQQPTQAIHDFQQNMADASPHLHRIAGQTPDPFRQSRQLLLESRELLLKTDAVLARDRLWFVHERAIP